MLRYMLDTNLCIRVLRSRPAGARERANREAGALCISTIILTELLVGAAKSNRPSENRREVERFAARLEVLQLMTVLRRMPRTYGPRWSSAAKPSAVTTR